MSAFNYPNTAATATRLLQRFGADATIKRTTTGAYDPSTGQTPVTVASLPTTAAVFEMPQKYIDGTLILQGDQQAFMAPGEVPKQGDMVNAKDSSTGVYGDYSVINVKAIGPAGVPVLFEAQLRG